MSSGEALLKDDTNFRVLIVDDDATILNLLRDLVSMVPGVTVFTASKAEDGMKVAVGEQIDIVFTDVHMPGLTGIEMIRDFISLQKTPEVIIMTAYPTGEIAQQAMELGASSLLSKPFDDIALVELELDKAIKKILRQRASADSVQQKKAELKSTQKEVDNDPMMKLSLGSDTASTELVSSDPAKIPSAPTQSSGAPSAPREIKDRRIYDHSLLRPLFEIEVERCRRYKRQFAFGLIEIPENTQLQTSEEKKRFREEQIRKLQSCFRTSDVVMNYQGDSFSALGFECNKTGVGVVEFKLAQAGFDFTGFSVYPTDATTLEDLEEKARRALNEKRRYKVLVIEPEEFFGRIVGNMLSDPRYAVHWSQDYEDAYRYAHSNSEQIKLCVLSLSQDPKQWELLARMKKECLIQWPILLFTEVALNEKLKTQLQQLGIRAIVRKGAGHEEFLYVVQSFVMQASSIVIRKNPRALVTVPVLYKEGRPEAQEVSSNSFTLSREGMFIRELNPLPTGTRLSVDLFIPGRKDPVKAQGEVIYSVPYFIGVNRIHVPGMAIRFIDLPETAQQELDRFIASTLTSYLI